VVTTLNHRWPISLTLSPRGGRAGSGNKSGEDTVWQAAKTHVLALQPRRRAARTIREIGCARALEIADIR